MEAVTPLQFDPLVLAGMMVTIAVAIFLPLIAAAVFIKRTGAPLRVLLQGALVFVVSQIVLRLPWLIPLQLWLKDAMKDPLFMVGFLLFAAVTAGLFEEFGRYVGYRKLIKEHSWRSGILFGLGHGGIESIIFVGLNVMGTAVGYVMMTRGGVELPPEQLEAVRKAFGDLTFAKALMGGVERFGAITLHVIMSLLVLRAFLSGSKKWLWGSIAVHAGFNFVVPLVAQKVNIYAAEAIMVALSAGGFLWLRRSRPFIENARPPQPLPEAN